MASTISSQPRRRTASRTATHRPALRRRRFRHDDLVAVDMLFKHEVGRGCGFDTTFPDRPGTFAVWGSARDQIDGFGNAVSPQVGAWIGSRLRAALDGRVAA